MRRLAALLAVASMTGLSAYAGAQASAGAGARASRTAAPGDSGGALIRLSSTPRPPLLRGARLVGAAPSGERLMLEVTLRVPDPVALQGFVAAVNDPGSPLFNRFLGPGAFGARFGPSTQQVATVLGDLRRAGLEPGPAAANRLSIPVVATVAEIDRALHTRIDVFRLPGGRTVFANTLPPALPAGAAAVVNAVLGLDDIGRVHDMLMRPRFGSRPRPGLDEVAGPAMSGRQPRGAAPAPAATAPAPAATAPAPAATAPAPAAATASASAAGPQPCSAAVQTTQFGGVTSNQIAVHYGMTPLYGLGDFGRGVRIALVEFEPHAASDIAAFESCYRIHTAVTTIAVDGGAGTGSGGGEAALDIEDVAGFAPDAAIDVYNAPQSGTDAQVEAEYSAIVSADRDQVISSSWGQCELDSDPGLITSEQALFEEAAAQGQTVLASAGDDGSTDCYNVDFPEPNPNKVSADDPGSQPDVVSVGGTTFEKRDIVWNESAFAQGAGGGAVSVDHCMPTYQDQPAIPGLVGPDSKKDCGGHASAYFRQTPDVTGDADPASGLVVYFGDDGGWEPIGGTSMTAPLWGAIAALVDASPYCSFYASGDAGARPAGLYAIAAGKFRTNAFTDVLSGNNDYTPSGYTGGLYRSTTGYDMASGLGYPVVVRYAGAAGGAPDFFNPGLAALMCHRYARRNLLPAISAISSGVAASNGEVPVLILGHGFLPVAGAEHVVVGNEVSARITCRTGSECTAVLPSAASNPGARVQVTVEGLTETPAFPYKYAPQGYWLASAHGAVVAVGAAHPFGGVTVSRQSPLIGIAPAKGGQGYWLVSTNGSVYAKGAARFEGSLPGLGVRVEDIVAVAPTADGRGYWMVGRDGGEFAFGDARFHGSLPGLGVHVSDIIGMVATADGRGYWLVGSDGGVFAFGDATFKGSLPGDHVHVTNIRALLAGTARRGYVLVGSDGGIFAFGGGVHYFGSLPSLGIHVTDITGLALTPDSAGYWLVGSDASVYAFGDAFPYQTPAAARAALPIVAIATS
jgi:hypothetical protein